jgi:hypothetical protein
MIGEILCRSIAGGDNSSRRHLKAARMGLLKIGDYTNSGRSDRCGFLSLAIDRFKDWQTKLLLL